MNDVINDHDRAPIRVIVAEDEEPLRIALADLIGGEDGLEVVGTASEADAAVELARTLRPDVALLDVRMPRGGGRRAAREIAVVSPGTRTIALSAYDDRSSVFGMLRAGAVSYVVKGAAPQELVEAIRRAMRGQSSLAARLVADLVGDVSRDVAERAEADDVVRRNEARFQRLLESAPDAVVIIEENGKILVLNERAVELFGYPRNELLGHPVEMLLPRLFGGSGMGRDAGYFSVTRTRAMGSGTELEAVRKDGVTFPVDMSVAAVDTEEGFVTTVFIRDLSERRKSDAILRKDAKHFEALLESAPDAVVIVDALGRVFYVNELTETLFDYDRQELLDQPIELLLPEGIQEEYVASSGRHRLDRKLRVLSDSREFTARRKDGAEFQVDISFSGIETADGRLVAAFVRDATERKARADLERSIATRQAVLAHLVSAGEDERRQIAADIHDDSIQVVTAAGIRLQILRRSLEDPDQLRLLDELGESIQSAISRLRHLLFELRPPALDHEGLGPALRMYLEVADEQTSTSYSLDDRLITQPPEATRVILYRIAQEVLTNVRKHACADNATVTLKEREGGYFVRITDDGVGFAPDAAARPGHLGIAAIRERAELAGGWLAVESTIDHGTTVEFWIASGTQEARSGASRAPVAQAAGWTGVPSVPR